LQAIELPVERQRRVTLAAVLDGVTHDGAPWRLRVASVHLENRPGARRLWVRAGAARSRQAAALLQGLEVGPWPGVDAGGGRDDTLVVGGDFNTWLGQREDALDRMRAAFPAWHAEDRRATMRGWLRLDYLFARLSPGARAVHRRLDRRYGSDHYPVVAAIHFAAQ
jgi:endonuclease/exonuclease/phosphatase family metal-dependent hydrolase